jgi:hypothetical protein
MWREFRGHAEAISGGRRIERRFHGGILLRSIADLGSAGQARPFNVGGVIKSAAHDGSGVT